jgi:hypothetical protein
MATLRRPHHRKTLGPSKRQMGCSRCGVPTAIVIAVIQSLVSEGFAIYPTSRSDARHRLLAGAEPE